MTIAAPSTTASTLDSGRAGASSRRRAATTTLTASFGFSCEGVPGSCVDRRLPCDDYLDCPKGHVCKGQPNSQFCLRVNQSCQIDDDCANLPTPWCADIDGDGTGECAGSPSPNDVPPGPACVNSSCTGGDTGLRGSRHIQSGDLRPIRFVSGQRRLRCWFRVRWPLARRS